MPTIFKKQTISSKIVGFLKTVGEIQQLARKHSQKINYDVILHYILLPIYPSMLLHGFLSEKMSQKNERQKESDTWIDWYLGAGSVSFLSRSSMYYITLTLQNPINLLNVVSTNSCSWASNFTSLTTWCRNELRRLKLAE